MSKPQQDWEGVSVMEIFETLIPQIIDYAQWYKENGLYLPPEYASDPGAWTDRLTAWAAALESGEATPEEIEEIISNLGHLFRSNG